MYQVSLPLLKSVCPPSLTDDECIAKLPTFRSATRMAVNHSGLTQEDIAENLQIDMTSFSRMLRDPRHAGSRPRELPHERLADFCLITGNLAPIQWHAFRMGMILVPERNLRIQQLERQLAVERAQAHMAQREVA